MADKGLLNQGKAHCEADRRSRGAVGWTGATTGEGASDLPRPLPCPFGAIGEANMVMQPRIFKSSGMDGGRLIGGRFARLGCPATALSRSCSLGEDFVFTGRGRNLTQWDVV